MRKLLVKRALPCLVAAALALSGCAGSAASGASGATSTTSAAQESTVGAASEATSDAAPVAAVANPDATLYSDRDWDASYTGAETIDCSGSENVSITKAGVYLLTGALNGSIVVDAGDEDKVQLVLQDLTVNSPDGPALWVKNADKVFLTLPEGSTATLTDSTSYTMLEDDEPNAAVFVDCDLTIQGSGALNVTGNYNHAIRSKDELTVTGGVLDLSGLGKGLKAKTTLALGGGVVTVTASKEGVEANDIIVTGGVLDVTATDDGINASSPTGWTGEAPSIQISGGAVLIDAMGDGVDSNGTMTVSGGVLLVSGPTNSSNGALDYETSGVVTGGVVIAAGAAGMASGFGSASTQGSWMTNLTATQPGGTSLTLVDADGGVLAHWTPAKDYQNVVVSSPDLQQGGSYRLLTGATVAGVDGYGFAATGTADGGDEAATTEMASLTQNDAGGGMGGMGGKGGGMRGEMPTDGTFPTDRVKPEGMPEDGTFPADRVRPEDGIFPTDQGRPEGMTAPPEEGASAPATENT